MGVMDSKILGSLAKSPFRPHAVCSPFCDEACTDCLVEARRDAARTERQPPPERMVYGCNRMRRAKFGSVTGRGTYSE